MKKITKREMFEQIKAHLTDETEKAFIDHELELLAKKNSSDKKPTKAQEANELIKAEITQVLATSDKKMTVTEIQKALNSDVSNQRVSALIRQLITDNKVQRIEEKRKAYFSLI